MSTKGENHTNGGQILVKREPRTLEFTKKGVKTGTDFANTMSALMSDVIEGTITPQVANAVCNAGGKLLKVVEMQYKYGKPQNRQSECEPLLLAPGKQD